jgi:AhpD family alkylhydroperoxidase
LFSDACISMMRFVKSVANFSWNNAPGPSRATVIRRLGFRLDGTRVRDAAYTREQNLHADVTGDLGGFHMAEPFYPPSSRELSETRRALAPDIEKAFQAFSQNVFAEGALSAKTKQLIAVAVAHVTQCPYCIRGHTKAALGHGVTRQELMEAIWVAAEMRVRWNWTGSTNAFQPAESAVSDERCENDRRLAP